MRHNAEERKSFARPGSLTTGASSEMNFSPWISTEDTFSVKQNKKSKEREK